MTAASKKQSLNNNQKRRTFQSPPLPICTLFFTASSVLLGQPLGNLKKKSGADGIAAPLLRKINL
jgi:hypothetical protein